MKTIDDNFNEIEVNYDFDNLIKNMVTFLASIGVDESIINEVQKEYSNYVIEYISSNLYAEKYKGVISKREFPKSLHAAEINIDQIQENDDLIYRYLKSAIEYSLSYVPEDKRQDELLEIKRQLEELATSFEYMESEELIDDLINEFEFGIVR